MHYSININNYVLLHLSQRVTVMIFSPKLLQLMQLTIGFVRSVRAIRVAITLPRCMDAVSWSAHEFSLGARGSDCLLGTGVLIGSVKAVEIAIATPSFWNAFAIQAHEFGGRTSHVGCKKRKYCLANCEDLDGFTWSFINANILRYTNSSKHNFFAIVWKKSNVWCKTLTEQITLATRKIFFLVEVEQFRWRLYYDMTYINNIGKTKKGYWSDNLEEKLLSMRIIDC